MAEPFACPRCGAVSHHPTDAAEGYCGRCHDWTGRDPRSGHLAGMLRDLIQQLANLNARVAQLELAVYDDDPFFLLEEERRPTEDVEVHGDLL